MLAIRAIVDGQLHAPGSPDLHRRAPPRRGLLLPRRALRPALGGRRPDRRGVRDRPRGDRDRRVRLVACPGRRRPGGGARGRPAGRRLDADGRRLGSALEPGLRGPGRRVRARGALEGRRRGDPRWWVAVGIGVVLAGQSHVLAWVLVAPSRSWPSTSCDAGRPARRSPWLAAAAGIVALSFLPGAPHELSPGSASCGRCWRPREASGTGRLPSGSARVFVPFRVLSVPLVGRRSCGRSS